MLKVPEHPQLYVEITIYIYGSLNVLLRVGIISNAAITHNVLL